MRRKAQATIGAAEGATEADWSALYEAHAPDLLAFLRRTTGDLSLAEDLLQESFARAMGAASKGAPVPARPWLFRIAANLAISHYRRQRIFAFIPLSGEQPADVDGYDGVAEQVRATLRSIPRDQAVALTLALHEGFTRREIAEMLETSEESIKSRLARGRRNFAAAYRRLDRGLAG